MPIEAGRRVVERWRYLRGMLLSQLAMFEAGTLTLRSNDADLAPAAIADLRRSILAFDALIGEDRQRRKRDLAPADPLGASEEA